MKDLTDSPENDPTIKHDPLSKKQKAKDLKEQIVSNSTVKAFTQQDIKYPLGHTKGM